MAAITHSGIMRDYRKTKDKKSSAGRATTGALVGGLLGGAAGTALPLDDLHPALSHLRSAQQMKLGLAGGALAGAAAGKISSMFRKKK